MRVLFSKGEEVRYISHLDLMRTWERTLRRAGVRLAYTQGFSPHPRLVFAAPLSVGVTSDGEIVDIFIEDLLSAAEFGSRITTTLPPGIGVCQVEEAPLEEPPVMAQVHSAEYLVELSTDADEAAARASVRRLMSRSSVPYERSRKGATRTADLRPVILDLRIEGWGERKVLAMRLLLDQEGATARPAEVVQALSPHWQVRRVHRTGLRLREAAEPRALRARTDQHAA